MRFLHCLKNDKGIDMYYFTHKRQTPARGWTWLKKAWKILRKLSNSASQVSR